QQGFAFDRIVLALRSDGAHVVAALVQRLAVGDAVHQTAASIGKVECLTRQRISGRVLGSGNSFLRLGPGGRAFLDLRELFHELSDSDIVPEQAYVFVDGTRI